MSQNPPPYLMLSNGVHVGANAKALAVFFPGATGAVLGPDSVLLNIDNTGMSLFFQPTPYFKVNNIGIVTVYNDLNLDTSSMGLPIILAHTRRSQTAVDGAPITFLGSVGTGRGQAFLTFRLSVTVQFTAFTSGSATQTLGYTSNAVAQTVAATASALNAPVQATNLVSIDPNTAITLQLTGVFVGTVISGLLVEEIS